MTRVVSALLSALAFLLVAGCSGEQEELQQWMAKQSQEVKPNVEPIAPPKKFVPQAYVSFSGAEPFSNLKLAGGSRLDARQSSNLLAAETRRRKEPLEAFPLDSLSMVGSVVKQGRPHALVKAESLLYYVKTGEYIGQNFGKVTKIGETEVTLREIVQDAAGEWIERTSTLQLQETAR
jgi:type IV pilus assembly protein PilP